MTKLSHVAFEESLALAEEYLSNSLKFLSNQALRRSGDST